MLWMTALSASAALVGTSWHYVRSTVDGQESEHVWVHRAAPDRLEVYKMRERCTNAAFVTARIDPATGEASQLVAGRLKPEGGVETFGTLSHEPETRRLVLHLDDGSTKSVAIDARPWHLYDYDLATLATALRQRGPSEASFSFGLALAWPTDTDLELRWLGRVEADREQAVRHLGRPTIRYRILGETAGLSGNLWLDGDGQIVDAQWNIPNHPGYADFRLRLVGTERGETKWRARIARHYADCPES